MTAEIADVGEHLVTVRLTGTLTESALAAVQQAMADIIRAQGRISILVLADTFTGWESGGTWDDFWFSSNFDAYIDKLAIVGNPRFEDAALMFTADALRPFPIEYFPSGDLGLARAWLGEGS